MDHHENIVTEPAEHDPIPITPIPTPPPTPSYTHNIISEDIPAELSIEPVHNMTGHASAGEASPSENGPHQLTKAAKRRVKEKAKRQAKEAQLQERKDSCNPAAFVENGPGPAYKQEKEAEALEAAETLMAICAEDDERAAKFNHGIEKCAKHWNAQASKLTMATLTPAEADIAWMADYFTKFSAVIHAAKDRKARDLRVNDMLDEYLAKFPNAAEQLKADLKMVEETLAEKRARIAENVRIAQAKQAAEAEAARASGTVQSSEAIQAPGGTVETPGASQWTSEEKGKGRL